MFRTLYYLALLHNIIKMITTLFLIPSARASTYRYGLTEQTAVTDSRDRQQTAVDRQQTAVDRQMLVSTSCE